MDYHALSVREVIEKVGSSENGLEEKRAEENLKKFGANELKKVRRFNALKVFLEQFKSFLILILIFAAIISFFMKSKIDAIVILAIVVINAGFGFFEEYKAEKAIEELKKMMVPFSKVMRNGKVVKIDSRKIVPGDILVLEEGDKINADARIVESNGLKINEAALTGESVPEEKSIQRLDVSLPLADRINMVYQGTVVVSGSGRAIVVETGMKTELGRISELVQKVKPEKNPFKDKLDSFAKRVAAFILALSALIVVLMVSIGAELFNSFLVAVSLAVSAIPEGLPAVISLGLAFATKRMLKRKILIRKLPASETLGRVTVICTDKTGTLTEEKMEISSIYANGKVNPKKGKDLLLKTGILCNKARLEKDEDDKEYFIGDPTEIALIISAKNNFLDKKELTDKEPSVKEFPFTSERKMMSIIRKSGRKFVSYVKGAPEEVIDRCDYELIEGKKVKLTSKKRESLYKVFEDMAKQGLRVLGFAYKEFSGKKDFSIDNSENNLVFVGFQGMIDPPRPEVKKAIKNCKKAGIKVLMITGDSKLTADAVAKQIGLEGEMIDSKELQKMSDKELFDKISNVAVFSRISPEDKLRIINTLKKKEIVAMTGDGVNDTLALKRADIGISMGIRGTDVARDASDMVLLDDNFASIVNGVEEGRRIYDNVKKFIKFLLSANFAEVILVILVVLIWRDLHFLPLLPLQILWINLAADILPSLALSSEPIEEGVMKRKPVKEGILKNITLFIIVVGLIAFLVDFIFFYLYKDPLDMTKAQTMIVTASVMFQMFLVFNCKSSKPILKSKMNESLVYAVIVSITLHLLVLYTGLRYLFHFTPLSLFEWIQVLWVSLTAFLFIEGFKSIRYKHTKK